jgi:hypothetical protein
MLRRYTHRRYTQVYLYSAYRCVLRSIPEEVYSGRGISSGGILRTQDTS